MVKRFVSIFMVAIVLSMFCFSVIAEGPSSEAEVASSTSEDAEEIILNYCNISQIPKGLEKTAYRMAMDLYRNEQPGTVKGSASGSVSSIEEGDTTVSFNTNSYDEAYAASLLKVYSKSLNRYRKVAW